ARNQPCSGDADHHLRVVLPEHRQCEDPAQLTKRRPVDLEDTARSLTAGARTGELSHRAEATLRTSAAASYFRRMSFWRRLFGGGGSSGDDLKPLRLDYLNEALALERQGDYDAALTSYRLALRDH